MNPHPTHLLFPTWSWGNFLDFYIIPDDQEEYLPCCRCGLKPNIWTFDNGRSTACGCWESQYKRWHICAESICSYYKHNQTTAGYNSNELKNNWNHYQQTGEVLFERPNGGREDGRW